ncbi:MAG: DUF971 domain-containing protein [Phycisphaerales bacterium]|nr:DUF971 domain-containing protein [Phycisphaerales bacterium]
MERIHPPRHLHLERDKGLTIEWAEGHTAFYPLPWLRRMSPSAEQRELRAEMERNPLTVLPSGTQDAGSITAESVELVGNYAIRIRFSDGHATGIYSWSYLREIEPKGDPG